MGQPINVVRKPGSEPGLVRFETNRVLTGMGHERYGSVEDVIADRTVDQLARRLFDTGHVRAVHANGNVVTVRLTAEALEGDPPTAEDALLDVISGLHIHYTQAAEAGDADAESEADNGAEVPASS